MSIRSAAAVLVLGLTAGLVAAAPASAGNNPWPKFTPLAADTTVQIQADFSGKCLAVADARTDDGAPVVEAACTGDDSQQWNITNGYAFNVHSGKCLEVPAWSRTAGTAIDQWTCNQGDNQRWGQINIVGSNTIAIPNWNSGLILDVDGANHADGTPVIQWYSDYHANQRFTLNPVG
ncbi:RICIN domain-containing protein [Kitasatospora sp. NPDC059722]|uniref:RICIN domain-containing protein n=1 Tax=unclassified Kitasatospora TaxID=2633591 RepID=UPI00367EC834